MKHNYIDSPNFIYLRVQWVTWQTSSLMTIGNFTPESALLIKSIIKNERVDYPIILDFKGVDNEMQGAFKELISFINENERVIVFINYLQLDEDINRYLKEFGSSIKQNKHNNILELNNNDSLKIDNLIDEVHKVYLRDIKEIIKKSFQKFSSGNLEYLSSTPILASGEYNASNIISKPHDFVKTSIALCDKFQEILSSKSIEFSNLRILSVSMRGSIFASVISSILGIDIDIIDHLGPKQRILEYDVLDKLKNENDFEYLYIGDFTIGGTEIKIAKTFANLNDIVLNDALVIGSSTESDVFKSQFNLHFLTSIKNLNNNAKYELGF